MKRENNLKNIHTGHRQRLKNQFLKDGIDSMKDHVVLELLLFHTIPQGDTNPTAHRLLDTFGSLSGVFDAPYKELLKVDGIGPTCATLIKLVPALSRRYMEDREKSGQYIFNAKEAYKLLRPKFLGRTNEVVILLLLNSKGKAVYSGIVNEGSVNTAPIYAREIVRLAAEYNADSAILAHNHPSGSAMPSSGDIAATREVIWALESINVRLADHIIVTDSDYASFSNSGWLELLLDQYNTNREAALSPAVPTIIQHGLKVADVEYEEKKDNPSQIEEILNR